MTRSALDLQIGLIGSAERNESGASQKNASRFSLGGFPKMPPRRWRRFSEKPCTVWVAAARETSCFAPPVPWRCRRRQSRTFLSRIAA